MAKSRNKRKAAPATPENAPTPEQQAKGEFIQGGNLATASNERAGLAYRRKAVIDVLRDEHKLTQRQYDGLARYRTVAVAADRSELRSCIDFSVRGSGEDRGHFGIRMNVELEKLELHLLGPRKVRTETTLSVLAEVTENAVALGNMERELRNLLPIARAVAVEDVTLTAWAVSRSGGKERLRGAVVAIEPSAKAFKDAWLDIRMAGEWLAAAIGA
jgi:hypothetical protein